VWAAVLAPTMVVERTPPTATMAPHFARAPLDRADRGVDAVGPLRGAPRSHLVVVGTAVVAHLLSTTGDVVCLANPAAAESRLHRVVRLHPGAVAFLRGAPGVHIAVVGTTVVAHGLSTVTERELCSADFTVASILRRDV